MESALYQIFGDPAFNIMQYVHANDLEAHKVKFAPVLKQFMKATILMRECFKDEEEDDDQAPEYFEYVYITDNDHRHLGKQLFASDYQYKNKYWGRSTTALDHYVNYLGHLVDDIEEYSNYQTITGLP